MLSLNSKELKTSVLHNYLLGAVGPRPIAFASTIDLQGNPNLAPFSFFNVFSANPPIAVFSPSRSGKTNMTKHTFDNIREVPEVVINVVNYNMVHQMSLASSEYPKGTNEFLKAGLTQLKSEKVKPFRVKESPVQMECNVNQVIELGNEGGAGNLVICEILLMHISEEVLDDKQMIDQRKIDLMARMGGNFYCRAHGDGVFEITKPAGVLGLGVDAMPEAIRNSKILSGNDLGQLGGVEKLPSKEEVEEFVRAGKLNSILSFYGKGEGTQSIAKKLIEEKRLKEAWLVLMSSIKQ